MIDPKLLRDSPEIAAANLARRGYQLDPSQARAMEGRRLEMLGDSEKLRAVRNAKSREIGAAMKRGDSAKAEALKREAEKVNAELEALEGQRREADAEARAFELDIPNLLDDDVPGGKSEADNVEVRKWGTPPEFAFAPKDHAALGEESGMMNFALAAKIAAARFVAMSGELARLHRALAAFMLDKHVRDHNCQEVYMPFMANPETLTGTGQLPKFGDEVFFAERDNLYLIPTAEVVVTNIARDETIPRAKLPMRFVCHTPCFRREAGSYGKDTRGMLRQHQFEKVELVQIAAPENSAAALEEMTGHAEAVLRDLELPYRVVSLCAGDIGFAAAKTYDIEVWMPAQNKYREISSCSNCRDFQARRMNARCRAEKSADNKKPRAEFVHTLNGSGVAVGRALIALMENRQTEDGRISVPPVLRPYMNGAEFVGGVEGAEGAEGAGKGEGE